ncbi:activator-dependent family glycosyltransferase [Nonomuraea polychroma]|uniref:activator-dependent family glycosyltransferase n=1 Tax=Nonomuraea polychroma TaxID=46176 RepID=UPI003D91B41D
MRVLFAAYAEKTHFLGMVPLAWALQTAGHEVRVASQPELTQVITRAGLTAVPVGEDHDFANVRRLHAQRGQAPKFEFGEDRPEVLTWEYLKEGYRVAVPWWWRVVNDTMIDDLVAFSRWWRPDLIVWETITFAGPIAAVVCGAAHARFSWSIDLFGRMRARYVRLRDEQPPHDREDILADWLAAKAGHFSEEMTTGHFTIDNVPPSLRGDPTLGLDFDLHNVPVQYVPYNGPAAVPDWLREPPERPRVCLTLGTTSTERFGGYAVGVKELLDALGDLDVEVVATLPDKEQAELGAVPANARLVTFAPLNALAPTCAVVINHGGPGTLFTTLLHGAPQLVLPSKFDEPFLAAYLAKNGAGLALPSHEATGAEVRKHVVRMLDDPSFAANARSLWEKDMLALPTPNQAVPELERLAIMHRGSDR